MDKFELGKFNPEEQDAIPDLLEYVNELLRLYLHHGVAQATTVINSTDLAVHKKEFQSKRKARNT
jgi:hypothetical protein|uniref:Uncharacterized protein n=1 Tax=Globisporangium ultimum (strain ATCC 200006 / CBS 805.95 / DAOM BR144) TaxID=431595 RepID=K3X865_GLOUD